MKGYMYLLRCSDGSYYTVNTNNLEQRMEEHQLGIGSYFTYKLLPIQMVYFEEFDRIDDAFYREKRIQGWSRKKKEALMHRKMDDLHILAKCQNESSSEIWHQKNHPSASLRDREM